MMSNAQDALQKLRRAHLLSPGLLSAGASFCGHAEPCGSAATPERSIRKSMWCSAVPDALPCSEPSV